MTSTDPGQVGTIVLRLGRLLESLNPLTVVATVTAAVEMLAEPPPGDPARLRQLAAAFAPAAARPEPVAAGVGSIGAGEPAGAWSGAAAARATGVLAATADLTSATAPAFRLAADAVGTYADTAERLR